MYSWYNETNRVYELDILGSIISAPHDNDNLFHFPAAYQRLDGSAAIGVIMFVTKSLGFVIQL
jgi:hypothetical protein